ncbi:hypothetical protein GDO78_014978 [Eleutherodactylus coqui]|uniref:Uncharacterized protein n=1 Tax=Eleutherodactylus coqui TaxID=57060 RepID=A0A8J6EE04_ELECQ|nr:hypothetical protein GDO78_014978 [Eleutherodactylus coqui]
MAAASQNIPPQKPELHGYYLQIPEKAEVKRVPISMLSSSVQQRISRLDGHTKTPDVIVVSPIIIQKLPNSHKTKMTATQTAAEHSQPKLENQSSDGRSTGKANKSAGQDHGTKVVPVKCCKDTALTILQLSRVSNEDTVSLEGELQTFSDSLILGLQAIKMNASALCMYNNMMYLLPESNNTTRSEEEREEGEQSETAGCQCGDGKTKQKIVPSKMEERGTNMELRHDARGGTAQSRNPCLQQQSGRLEVGATLVKLWDEDRWDLPAGMNSSSARPSTSPCTENDLQIYFWKHSEKQKKRKPTSVGNQETFLKKLCLSASDTEPGLVVAKDVLTCSPLHPDSSSGAPSPPSPHECPSSLSPVSSPPQGNTAGLEGLSSSSSLLCNIPPRMAPAPLGPATTCMSTPCFKAKSSPSLSDFPSSENSNELKETASSSDPSVVSNHLRFDLDSCLDVDDTTRDERTQRLLERVRELDKIVEDIRLKKLG